MKDSTYFVLMIPLLVFYVVASWNDIVWTRFFLIWIALSFLLLSGVTMAMDKERKQLRKDVQDNKDEEKGVKSK